MLQVILNKQMNTQEMPFEKFHCTVIVSMHHILAGSLAVQLKLPARGVAYSSSSLSTTVGNLGEPRHGSVAAGL
jgi:hypothetical protein